MIIGAGTASRNPGAVQWEPVPTGLGTNTRSPRIARDDQPVVLSQSWHGNLPVPQPSEHNYDGSTFQGAGDELVAVPSGRRRDRQ